MVLLAPFAATLGGYRAGNGNPNASDSNDSGSVRVGIALLRAMEVPDGTVGPDDPGGLLEVHLVEHLSTIRPDLEIAQSRQALAFAQYAHLAVFPAFRREYQGPDVALSVLEVAVERLGDEAAKQTMRSALERVKPMLESEATVVRQLKDQMPEESLLKIDVTVGEAIAVGLPPMLHVGLSSKWSLRTDRAQDCVSQGAKLVSQRRGRMPHFAVITMEPRPAMLKILADGSGAIDCVYHLQLPALVEAMEDLAKHESGKWSPKLTFDRMLRQGRLRDYNDLVQEVERLPRATPPLTAGLTAP